MKKINELEKKLGLKFKNVDLLKQALTHSSYSKEHPEMKNKDNERLEFLGDAILNFITSEILYQIVNKPEGDLTILKTNLVDKESLVRFAEEINLGQCLLLGRGLKLKGETKKYLSANAYEALIGAIYLDKGLKKIKDFLKEKIITKISIISGSAFGGKNVKNYLQEITQEKFKILPVYRVIKEEGPPHNRIFTIAAILNNKEFGRAKGKSKKEAEIKAAEKTIKLLNPKFEIRNTK